MLSLSSPVGWDARVSPPDAFQWPVTGILACSQPLVGVIRGKLEGFHRGFGGSNLHSCARRAPVALSALRGRRLLFRPGVALQGALAHYTAEALLCAPGVLGSLELLLNPMGLLSSVSAGLADLLGLPLAALMAGSPAQVDHVSTL